MPIRQTKHISKPSHMPERFEALRELLADQGASLRPDQCRELQAELDISSEALMAALLPVAGRYGRVPVSRFPVGAVVKAQAPAASGFGLYLGANLEFAGHSLDTAVHAEQAAVLNAWHQGARHIAALAVSAPPCGYCRQFLTELAQADSLTVLIARGPAAPASARLLGSLLPHPFGPRDLGQSPGLMAAGSGHPSLELNCPTDDPLVQGALAAAAASYAPYTRNWAGCGIQGDDGRVYFGRYAECAAFNPSIGPFAAALVNLAMERPEKPFSLQRAVLVEHPTAVSQRRAAQTLLESLAPDLKLQYFAAHPQ